MKTPKKHAHSEGFSANVSTLKTHLGQYLKKVKAGGEVTVYDRQLPVAKLIAFDGNTEAIAERKPTVSLQEVARFLGRNDNSAKITKLKHSSLFYLNEDRGSR